MPGARRGLVAPQNTFLENIIRRSNGQRKCLNLILVCNGGMWGVLGDNYHSFIIYNEELNSQGNMRPTVTSLLLICTTGRFCEGIAFSF